MKPAILFLLLGAALLSGCGGANASASNEEDPELRVRAKVAEANMVKIRDALLAYHEKNKEVPGSVSDLESFGAAESDMVINDDYSEVAYSYYNVEFDDAGKMTRCWLIATPITDTGALLVRMNGVTGNFDYVKQGEKFGPAPDDKGWGNSPPKNEPAGMEVK